jgi:hypothetical protein
VLGVGLMEARFEPPLLIADRDAGSYSNAQASNAVDIFDAISGIWRTSALKDSRADMAATSLPNQGLAIFAGGRRGL